MTFWKSFTVKEIIGDIDKASNFTTIEEIIGDINTELDTTRKDIVVFNTLDCLVRRLFYLISNIPDDDFSKYIALQRELIKSEQEKQKGDYKFAGMFFDLLEQKRNEYKALMKIERV